MAEVNRSVLRVVGGEREPSERELMRRVARGDEASFGLLYDRLSPLVFGVVVTVVKDRAIAEEVTQEVFVELWRLATRFDDDKGSVRGWTATLAHRRAVDQVRSEQSRRTREERDVAQSLAPTVDDVAEQVEAAFDHADVRDALDALTAKQREAVTLAYFGGHTYHEVAALLEVPEGTVKTRIRDALIKLRDSIGRTR